MTTSFFVAIAAVGASVASIITFIIGRMKDSEMRGRSFQRMEDMELKIKLLEAGIKRIDEKLASHDMDIAQLSLKLDNIDKTTTSISNKLDRLLDRQYRDGGIN